MSLSIKPFVNVIIYECFLFTRHKNQIYVIATVPCFLTRGQASAVLAFVGQSNFHRFRGRTFLNGHLWNETKNNKDLVFLGKKTLQQKHLGCFLTHRHSHWSGLHLGSPGLFKFCSQRKEFQHHGPRRPQVKTGNIFKAFDNVEMERWGMVAQWGILRIYTSGQRWNHDKIHRWQKFQVFLS